MAKKFIDNRIEGCTETPKQRAKRTVKLMSKKLKQLDKQMGVMKDMWGNYEYHQDTVERLIGQVTINIEVTNQRLEEARRILK